jgi:transcriptional regulator with XRE-family HTH domain
MGDVALSISLDLKRHFAQNLRALCGRHKSVSEVCRRLDINRQQFNKYLAGTALPSPHVLSRICQFFAVAESDMLMAPVEFAARSAGMPQRTEEMVGAPLSAPLEHIASHFPDSARKLERYLGYYHSYYCSPAFPGRILRSLSQFVRKGDQIYDRTIERLHDHQRSRTRTVVKYVGTVFHTDDRIYVSHVNFYMHQTMSMLALYPSYRPNVGKLSGVFVSVSSGPGRQPFAARAVYEYLGVKPSLRQALGACGLYPLDSPEISEDTKLRVSNVIPEGETTLRALEY